MIGVYAQLNQHFTDNVSTAPTVEPVDVSEIEDVIRVVDTPDDHAYLTGLIKAARRKVERETDRSLLTQTRKLYLDTWPTCIELRHPPIQSVTSITYVDTGGTTTTWTSSEYRTDLVSEPGRIEPAYGYTWPTIRGISNAITVTYVAGYGDGPEDLPGEAIEAVKLGVRMMFVEPDNTQLMAVYQGLLDSFRWRPRF